MQSDQYQDWPCTSIWGEQTEMRRQLTMLSDENNIPMPSPAPEESSKNNDSPPAAFTIANASVNMGISLGTLVVSIAAFAYTYHKDRREKGEKESIERLRKSDEQIRGQMRILQERVDRLATLRGVPRGRG